MVALAAPQSDFWGRSQSARTPTNSGSSRRAERRFPPECSNPMLMGARRWSIPHCPPE